MTLTPQMLDAQVQEALRVVRSNPQQGLALGLAIQQRASELQTYRHKGEGCGLLIQGIAHFYSANYELAQTTLRQAIHQLELAHDHHWQIRAMTALGSTYRELGDLPSALAIHHRQLAMCRAYQDTANEVRALNGIAAVYEQIKEYAKALGALQNALLAAQSLHDLHSEAVILGNICSVYLQLGRSAEALEAGQRSLALFDRITLNLTDYLNTLLHVGIAYQRSGDFELAEHYLEQTREIAEKNEINALYLQALMALGKMQTQRGQLSSARFYLHQALAKAAATHAEKSLYECYEALAQVYRQLGKWETAYHYLEQYYRLKETIFNDASDLRIRLLEHQYQAEATRKEAEHYRQRVQEQEKLREQEKQAYERLTSLKSQFIRSATHDLNNPISAIKLLLHLIERNGSVVDLRGRQLWERLLMQMNIIQGLVGDMLDYARLETGYGLEMAEGTLNPMLTELLALARAQAAENGIYLKTDDACLAAPVEVDYDAARMNQALRTLLQYIIRRMPSRETLTIEFQQQGQRIILRFLASGWYIAPEDQQELFQPFFRARSFDDKPSQGSGLGLALVKAIIEQHNGQIVVASHRETGSRFQVTLPLRTMART